MPERAASGEATEPVAVGRPRSRSFAPTVGVGLLGAALAAVAGNKDWARAYGSTAGIAVHGAVKGSEAAPLASALALVTLAAWGVVLVSRGRVRRLVALLGALASFGVLAAFVDAFDGARRQASRAVSGQVPGGAGSASLTGWYWAAGVGALLTLGAFVVAVRVCRGWPAMGAKYDAPGRRAEQPVDERDMWRALDEGHDPTA